MRTVPYQTAPEVVKTHYELLRQSLGAKHLPLFFTYLGAYPEYLAYIEEQLTRNMQDPTFIRLTNTVSQQILRTIHEGLKPTQQLASWLSVNAHSPAFYYFQQDLTTIHTINMKMAYVFVALREAVKGWAVAAKQLPRQYETKDTTRSSVPSAEPFLFHDTFGLLPYSTQQTEDSENTNVDVSGNEIIVSSRAITQTSNAIQAQLLPQYLHLAKNDFEMHMHTTPFWTIRTGVETIILQTLPMMPNLIFSPINVTIELVKKYDDFADLLYLLSEHFPTYAVQRMMFSGYMLNK